MEDPPITRKPCCVCGEAGGKHCTLCKARHYCSRKCQLVDWKKRGHKEECKQLAIEFAILHIAPDKVEAGKVEAPETFSPVALAPEKLAKAPEKIAKAPEKVEAPAAKVASPSSKGAKVPSGGAKVPSGGWFDRGPAVKVPKAPAPKDESWRGHCALCFDLLAVEGDEQTFYECCARTICTPCTTEHRLHDDKCPCCRALPTNSHGEAIRRLQKHVDAGLAEAQFVSGDVHFYGKLGLETDPKGAAMLYALAAKQGHAVAQAQLGSCYDRGTGVPADSKLAVRWYRRAAEQGVPRAQHNLGAMYYQGAGVAQSHGESMRWYKAAANQGHVDAICSVGSSYANGLGVKQDLPEAIRLFTIAAAKGRPGAAEEVERLTEFLEEKKKRGR